MDGTKTNHKGYLTNIITDKAIDWLENKRDKQRPFALFIHHKACHRNWLPELKYLHEYEDQTFAIPETFYDNYEGRPAAQVQEMSIHSNIDMDLAYDVKLHDANVTTRLSPNYISMIGRLDSRERAIYDQFYDSIAIDFRKRNLQGRELSEFKFQRYMRDYAKVLKSLDDNVGRTLDYLEKAGLLENTLVVYTSDQGFYMGEHGWFDKRFMYEESFRTPLVMRLPNGLSARGDIQQMVQNIDYAPTFLDLCGLPIPEDMHGISMLPLLKGEQPKDWRTSLYYHFHEFPAEHAVKRHYGVRTERYTLIHFYEDIDVWELYDLQTDPQQLNNIYGQKGTEKITKKLKKELLKLQQQYNDPAVALTK
jgi:arylsulfatase A-like enzyme